MRPFPKKRQPLRAWVAERLIVGHNYSGVDGESEERIQITKRDQRRSQPTATLRGSVDINASVIFCLPRAHLRGKSPTRASYKFRASVERQPSGKDEKKQGLSLKAQCTLTLVFFSLYCYGVNLVSV